MTLPPFVWLISWLLLSAPFVYIIGRIDVITGRRRGLARWLGLLCLAVAWWAFGRALTAFYTAGAPELVSQATWTLGVITMRFDGLSLLLAAFGDLPSGMLAVVAFGFLLAAMAKSAQFPLHIWLPDAMEAPTPVSALIHAATMVNAGVYLLARFYPAFAGVAGWTTTVIIVGLASVLLAGLLATTCHDLKRTLAYSTVSQLGFMVTGVGLGAIFESQFYLLSHALFKALLFLGAGAIIHHAGTRDMRRMGGLWGQMRAVAVPFLIGAAALMGLPLSLIHI